jgi:hypothetical protein
MEIWAALVIGFMGSFHCVGMCGPIAMSIPRGSSNFLPLTINAVLYNFGRISTYSVFGFLFGLIGTGITISGFQGSLSIILGVVIICGVLFNNFLKPPANSFFIGFKGWVTQAYGKLLHKKSKAALAGLGVLNGLLPCPFVYSALAVAVLTSTPVHSAAFMAVFGLGTFPAMYFMYLSPNILSQDVRIKIRSFIPYLAIVLGLVLILRGLILFELFIPVVAEHVDNFLIFPGNTVN